MEPDEKRFFMRIHADLKNMGISQDALYEILMAQVKKMNAKMKIGIPLMISRGHIKKGVILIILKQLTNIQVN